MLLHDTQELDNDLGGRTNEDLSLATAFGVVDVVQAIVQDGDSHNVYKEMTREWEDRSVRVRGSLR
jgi:hypothetical protein